MKIDMKIITEDMVNVNGIWQIVPNSRIENPANSLVKQFLQILKVRFSYVTLSSAVRDTGNTLRTYTYNTYSLRINAGAGVTTHGIVVGTGTDAVTISDYKLQTLIEHGNGAGQLSYGAVLFDNTDVTVSGSACYYDIKRVLTNNSGGNITVTEVGLYSVDSAYYYMFDRTLYSKTINNGAGAIFTYRMQISV